MTVAYGRLEWSVAFLTQCLLCDNQRVGQTITASLQFTPMVELAVRLGRIRLPTADQMRALEALMGEVRGLVEKRHSIAHGFLSPPLAEGHHISIRLRARGYDVLNVTNHEVKTADLDAVADAMQAMIPKVYDFALALPPELIANYVSSATGEA